MLVINNEEFHKAVNPRKEERYVMPKPKTPIPVAIFMTDEEIQAYHKKKQKEDLLEQLIAATNRPFSVKNLEKKKESKKERSLPAPTTPALSLDNASSTTLPKPTLQLDDKEFQAIRDLSMAYGSASPIEKVTDYALGEFRLEDLGIREEDEENKHYKNLFKQEQAMLSEILRDVSEQAKWANNRLKEMTKKSSGYGGVAKTYPDLISAANSLNHTRFSIVTKMADLKKTLVDLEMKRVKEIGPDEKENKDTLADQFFAQIVGNRKQFMDSAMSGVGYSQLSTQSVPELPYNIEEDYDEPSFQGGYQEAPPTQMRSITAPLYPDEETAEELYQEGGHNEFDPYGYIHNENRNIRICIQRFSDGRLEFVALDENNESVDDYELPDDDLLLSLEIRPFSNYASDEFGRRYQIINIDSEGIDISDV